jgi:hypothetical protein
VVLSTCNGVSGDFEVDGEVYSVSPAHQHAALQGRADAASAHVVYRASDLKEKPRRVCGGSTRTLGVGVVHRGDEDDDESKSERGRAREREGHSAHDLHVGVIPPYRIKHVLPPARERPEPEPLATKNEEAAGHGRDRMELQCLANNQYANYTPPAGCECRPSWSYNGQTVCNSQCALPDNDPGGPWCFTSAACNGRSWAYCSPSTCLANNQYANYTPPAGCQCRATWTYNGVTVCNSKCALPDNDPGGAWCYTTDLCNGNRWAYCAVAAPTCTAIRQSFTNFTPSAGCFCRSQWSYAGKTYCEAKCENPDNDPNGPWCYTNATCNTRSWSYCAAPVTNTTSGGGGGGGSGSGSGSGGTTTAPPSDSGSTSSTPNSHPVTSGTRNVELFVVADESFVIARSRNLSRVQADVVNIANGVQQRYQKFNMGVNVALVAILLFNSPEPSSLRTTTSESMDTYLNRFTQFRIGLQGRFNASLQPCSTTSGTCVDYTNDNAQLLTNDDRSGSTTGLAWVGTMCEGYSAGVNEARSSPLFVTETVAHEMGHNWGMAHDGNGNSCDQSSFIMAAVADSGASSEKDWSACSRVAITTTLQQLEASGSSNCLRNIPTRVGGSARCGDGIVSSPEQCDLGARNGASGSPCRANCTLVSTAQCASGECCDTSTGRFRPAGTRCRAAAHDCDLEDACSGTSALCNQDVVKRDGTRCTSAGPNSKCYRGQCVGVDGQCALAWSGYTGTWVGGGRDGIVASCYNSSNECSDLLCTNREWDDYCYSYNCPSGYRCTVAGTTMTGPSTRNFCSCMTVQNSVTRVFVRDGTPCGPASEDRICVNRACVLRPTSSGQSGQCTSRATCSNRGECGEGGLCSCDAGFTGSRCEIDIPCNRALCQSLNRQACLTDDLCGECAPGFATNELALQNSTRCELLAPPPLSLRADATVSTSSVDAAFDRNLATAWVALFDPNSRENRLPVVELRFPVPFPLVRYDIQSAASAPAMDPSAWLLEGSVDGQRWDVVDQREGVFFEARSAVLQFLARPGVGDYALYRWTVAGVRDAANQGDVTVNINSTTNSTGDSTNVTTDFSSANGSYVPRMHVAELFLYSDAALYEERRRGSGPSAATIGGIVAACVAGGIGIAVLVGVIIAKRRRRSFKNAAYKDGAQSNAALGDVVGSSASLSSLPMVPQGKRGSAVPVVMSGSVGSLATPAAPVASEGADEWVQYTTERDGRQVPYWYNARTNESRWQHP